MLPHRFEHFVAAVFGIDASEEGLSANASKVQELADTLASEIEAEGIAASDDPSEADKDDEDDDI